MSDTLHPPEEVEIVMAADRRGRWHWRIKVDGEPVESSVLDYSDMGICLARARIAYSAYVQPVELSA